MPKNLLYAKSQPWKTKENSVEITHRTSERFTCLNNYCILKLKSALREITSSHCKTVFCAADLAQDGAPHIVLYRHVLRPLKLLPSKTLSNVPLTLTYFLNVATFLRFWWNRWGYKYLENHENVSLVSKFFTHHTPYSSLIHIPIRNFVQEL